MKYYFSIILLLFTLIVNAQTIYLSTLDDRLLRLNIEDCQYDFVTDIQTSIGVTDISFHPNRNLYGIDYDGNLFEIDTISGVINTIHSFSIDQLYNSLTIADDGQIYACGSGGELMSYDLTMAIETYHGDIPFSASGDLTFFNGDLYAAVSGNRIVKVDIDTPENSEVIIEGSDAFSVFGIITYIDECRIIRTYAVSDGKSNIYEIDFDTKSLQSICNLDIRAGGGASTFEFLGASAAINIERLDTLRPDCDVNNGTIIVNAVADTGTISFSIDGMNFQPTGIFENLPVGDYRVIINNDIGCPIYRDFVLTDGSTTMITNIRKGDTKCIENEGFIAITAEGGTGNLQYSIDNIIYQSDNIIRNLTEGEYNIYIKDEKGCRIDSIVIILQNDCDIYIPNAFSPNNDGINDLFRIYPSSNFLGRALSFKIFDRWGGLMFERADFDIQTIGWDGIYRGKTMNPGTYIYVIEVEMENGEKQLLKGDVTLLR
ncbi:MAG: gliding motility-associated C-terminal domain-containing protein [Saprospiraceae bacterium]